MDGYSRGSDLCRNCSQCCKALDEPLYLTSRDVFAISYEMNLAPTVFLKKHTKIVSYRGFPLVKMLELKNCVFDKHGSCALVRKPDMCAAFPHGDAMWLGRPPVEQKVDCKINPELVIPRLKPSDFYNLPYFQRDPFLSKWSQAMAVVGMMIEGIEKESDRLEVQRKAVYLLYQDYNLEKQFIPQFDSNVLKLISLLG